MTSWVALVSAATSVALAGTSPAWAKAANVAVFDFDLVNTSPAASTPEELARLHRLDTQLHEGLEMPGRYRVVDKAGVRDQIAQVASIRGCNGCERDLARQLGAEYAAYGWVQKVSNLILNINLVIEDAATGTVVKAGSVDIRGNTDESWQRGLHYLLNERLFRE